MARKQTVSMNRLFDVLTGFQVGDVTKEEALTFLKRTDTRWLKSSLVNLGLPPDALPANAEVLARLFLALHGEESKVDRVAGPRSIEGLLEGTLYANDDPQVISRMAFKKGDHIEVWDVMLDDKGVPSLVPFSTFNLQHIYHLDISRVPHVDDPRPDENEPGEQPPEKTAPPPEEEEEPLGEDIPVSDQVCHYQFNLKVVMWIPYVPNEVPLFRKFLPEPLKSMKMSQELRLGLRIALATGNPTPPKSLTDAQYTALIQSKEFRGTMRGTLTLCCGKEIRKDVDVTAETGFTPPASGVEDARLNADHNTTQNLGSYLEAILSRGGPLANQLTGAGTGAAVVDQIEDALDLIKEFGRADANESFTKGEGRSGKTVNIHPLFKDCLLGTWSNFVRVGKINNLLNYALTGNLIRFQGGVLNWFLCCSTGKLLIAFNHSTIPSFKLYLNDKEIYEYSMLTASIAKIKETFYQPTSEDFFSSKADLKRALLAVKLSPLSVSFKDDFNLKKMDGCPIEGPG